jgi:signal transduction histidine kinase
MQLAASPTPQFTGAPRRDRARRRLYVGCQIGGWGLLLAFQMLIVVVVAGKKLPMTPARLAGLQALGFLLGLGLTHYSRRLIVRWGWKRLSWRALLPRLVASSLALGIVWTAVSDGLIFGILRAPTRTTYSPAQTFALQCVNDSLVMFLWLGFYFGYHIYDRFNRAEVEQQRLSLTVKEAELRALKSQVNPHFIFNALNSLRSLIDEDPGRARRAVTQLANLLRYSLQSGQLETVPFAEELEVVKDYLALEQNRFESRLRVRLEIAPETLDLLVPPMLLQTLVENAVKYGIAQEPEGGEIAILARCEAGQLRLQVDNPGNLARPEDSAAGSTGVGLRNAAERLRLLFGEQARLALTAAAPGRVLAEVVIPRAPANLPIR